MKLITVDCYQKGPNGDLRRALTVADTPAEAEELCRQAFAAQGYTRFNRCQQVDSPEAYQDGPARFVRWLGGDDVT
jgi:hypothetical protein